MKDILKLKPFAGKLQCETCTITKCTRLPFDEGKTHPKKPLGIINSDVRGIVRLPTIGGHNYFVTFIDGYSRYAIAYLIKSKNEVFTKFKVYKAAVERKHDRKIKEPKTDNGTEYLSTEFVNYLKEGRINFQYTTVKTPQQNGIAERFNRT